MSRHFRRRDHDDMLFDASEAYSIRKAVPPLPLPQEPTEVKVFDWDEKRKQWAKEKEILYAGLPPFVKNFYKEDEAVANMTEEEVSELRFENRKISVSYKDQETCTDAPNPVRCFREAWQHYPDLLELLEERYERPSPIQMQLWPVLLQGRDAVGIAQTGTGKTLAFLLPGVVNIQSQPPASAQFTGPAMVVLAPTRELALQIHEEVNKLNYSKIQSVCIYGKGDRKKQLDGLAAGAQVVVATPGRLDDLIRSNEADLRRVSYVVLDEADKMLDMGFMHHLSLILSKIREDRQIIMTSATWNSDIYFVAKNYLKNEITVRVGERELETANTVTQEILVCEQEDKLELLIKELRQRGRQDKGLVFVNKRAACDPLCGDIRDRFDYSDPDTLPPDTLYGSMDQEAREQTLEWFRCGEVKLLVCTDVAARGLDVLDVTFVFHYDLPRNLEEYVHRSGRTGRAGRTGHVITLVTWQDRFNAANFIKLLERSNTVAPAALARLAQRAERGKGGRGSSGSGRRGGGYGGRGGGDGTSWGESCRKREETSVDRNLSNSSYKSSVPVPFKGSTSARPMCGDDRDKRNDDNFSAEASAAALTGRQYGVHEHINEFAPSVHNFSTVTSAATLTSTQHGVYKLLSEFTAAPVQQRESEVWEELDPCSEPKGYNHAADFEETASTESARCSSKQWDGKLANHSRPGESFSNSKNFQGRSFRGRRFPIRNRDEGQGVPLAAPEQYYAHASRQDRYY